MSRSNPFGQSSGRPQFSIPPVFERTNNASSDPFAPGPFGNASPFASQSVGSIFGGMPTSMFGGQSSAPLGSTSVFGASSSPVFGSSSPSFGSAAGSSVFGQKPTSGGIGFNTTQTSSFGTTFQQSQPAFGSNLFGSQTPFGSPSTLAFGSTPNLAFGNRSGGFGISSSPFGFNTPTFEATSTQAFGATRTPALGSCIGTSTTPAFGQSCANPFSSSTSSYPFAPKPPVFGNSGLGSSSTSAFGLSPFGTYNTSNTFGSASLPTTSLFDPTGQIFRANATPPSLLSSFATPTSLFGSGLYIENPQFSPLFQLTTPALPQTSSPFGQTSSAFGQTASAFGQSSLFKTPSGFCGNSFSSSSSLLNQSKPLGFGQTTSSLAPPFQSAQPAQSSGGFSFNNVGQQQPAGTSGFGATPCIFGQSAFGQASAPQSTLVAQAAPITNPVFGGRRGGSRVSPYSPTPETDGASGTQPGKLLSISAMPVYIEKSHEELRFEDYLLGDKGGPAPAGQSNSAVGFGSGIGTSTTTAFGQPSANSFSSSTSTNPGFGSSTTSAFGSSPFGTSNTSNPFGSASSATTSLFGSQGQACGANTTSPSLFSNSGTSAFGSPSNFGPAAAQGTASAFSSGLNFGNSQSSPLFQSTTPSLPQTSSPFGQTTSAFGQTASAFGQSSVFNPPSSGFGSNIFSSSSSLLNQSNPLGFGQTTSSLATLFQSAQPAQSSGGFSFTNFGQQQPGIETSTASAFGASFAPAFRASSAPAFGATSVPAFGASFAPAFDASSTPFNFRFNPTIGLSTTLGDLFNTTSSFGVQRSSFGGHASNPAFGGQRGGSRIYPYSPTLETNGVVGTQPGKLQSIAAMSVYEEKSHEELRFEDYMLGDKGGSAPASAFAPRNPVTLAFFVTFSNIQIV